VEACSTVGAEISTLGGHAIVPGPEYQIMNHDLSVTDRRAELAAERRRLAYVRECLTESQAAALRTAEGAEGRGDEDAAYWFYRRAWQLEDRESSPLFFGRLDGPEPEPIYIGRRYVSDADTTPVTIDWRTPMAARFYRASPSQPMEVTRRRRYGFSADNQLTGFDDEVLAGMSDDHELSVLVRAEIERAHYGPMRDIVATIQPDQDHIIRLGMEDVLVVQGGPGTGKTAVGLHRAASGRNRGFVTESSLHPRRKHVK
jgi:DNA helicase IV